MCLVGLPMPDGRNVNGVCSAYLRRPGCSPISTTGSIAEAARGRQVCRICLTPVTDRRSSGGPSSHGSLLRQLRQERGISQAELARGTGMARTYVIALEQGRHEPSLDLLRRVAAALGMPLAALLWFLAGEPFADPAAPLAARVRLRRQRLGLSAAELAARAETTRATISQIEGGTNANPSLRLLARLAKALQCCPSELAPPRQ